MLLLVPVLAAAVGCAEPGLHPVDPRLQVVTTTGILRDLVANVGGDRVVVTSIVPDGADPHAFEPSLRAIRDVVYADVAFSNYLLLEQHSIVKALDANLQPQVPNISLAEAATGHSAEVLPLVEDVNLDTVWLGLRVRGDGQELGADRTSDVLLHATSVDGPGRLVAYLTGAFGQPQVLFDSGDGFDRGDGYRDDTAALPADAHTHLSWAFTAPGVYRLRLTAQLAPAADRRPVWIGEAEFRFAVGVDAASVPGAAGATVIDAGHADLTVDLVGGRVALLHDPDGGGAVPPDLLSADQAVIEVPARALTEVPPDPGFRFLGRAGELVHQLPQAVLGRHIHGEIDPHLWHDVRNAIAYVEVIRDVLAEADPAGAADYRVNADRYIGELDRLDRDVRATIAAIPEVHRHLVTTHDAFAYLGAAYDIEIAGFVTADPSREPSLADRRKLTETIRNLSIPAVFLEPNLAARASTLVEVARENGVAVCRIYGDAFDGEVTSYVELMRFNADSLRRCLAPSGGAG